MDAPVIGAGVRDLGDLLPQIPKEQKDLMSMASELRRDLLALQGARARPQDIGVASGGVEVDLLDSISQTLQILVPKLRETDFPDPK